MWFPLMMSLFGEICCQAKEGLYSRAHSYLIVSGQKTPVCYDAQMIMSTNIVARSSSECLIKCLITTKQNLRGINYMSPVRSCSCVHKLNNIWYNVTADLNASCLAFVSHDCPKPFDYIIEVHKCYSLVNNLMNWSTAGKACNNASGHLLAVEDEYENLAASKYPQSVSKGVNIPLSFFGWCSGEPNGVANGNNYCLQYIILPECAWDDYTCTMLRCSLCEIDITL
ncbi:hypothetical protein HELRODRAFT_172157 [Helobdella robusta]|uniref:C-type lectin domain-containing protein n=1 Tax=Helobdella robusta TaxID=6412 RepID=T1F530_HELRO|nr:hypothetical protein HELRODRAFT_172157 [Helobdella robusta]ESO04510.1 hypothetical protein HELRODRAFT_172157 [Helobdella robusta]